MWVSYSWCELVIGGRWFTSKVEDVLKTVVYLKYLKYVNDVSFDIIS